MKRLMEWAEWCEASHELEKQGDICLADPAILPAMKEFIKKEMENNKRLREAFLSGPGKVILKIAIATVDGQHLNSGDTGTLTGSDRDHYFVDFNGEAVAFRRDEAEEEIIII